MIKTNTRLEKILLYIQKRNFTTVKQLSAEVEVSEMTIRRDLLYLAEQNLVKRVYGGVTPVYVKGQTDNTYILQTEQDKNWTQKLSIARKAVTFINPNDVIFFDSGSTVQAVAEQINDNYSYTCISSSFNSLTVLTQLKNSSIITPGGVFSYKPKVFYDLNSVKAIRKYRANICFIGATGYEINLGATCAYPEDAPIKQAMMDCSKVKILLLDSSKFSSASTYQFAEIEQFSLVITNTDIPENYIEHIKSHGVEMILV